LDSGIAPSKSPTLPCPGRSENSFIRSLKAGRVPSFATAQKRPSRGCAGPPGDANAPLPENNDRLWKTERRGPQRSKRTFKDATAPGTCASNLRARVMRRNSGKVGGAKTLDFTCFRPPRTAPARGRYMNYPARRPDKYFLVGALAKEAMCFPERPTVIVSILRPGVLAAISRRGPATWVWTASPRPGPAGDTRKQSPAKEQSSVHQRCP